jgi:hypothetical protein
MKSITNDHAPSVAQNMTGMARRQTSQLIFANIPFRILYMAERCLVYDDTPYVPHPHRHVPPPATKLAPMKRALHCRGGYSVLVLDPSQDSPHPVWATSIILHRRLHLPGEWVGWIHSSSGGTRKLRSATPQHSPDRNTSGHSSRYTGGTTSFSEVPMVSVSCFQRGGEGRGGVQSARAGSSQHTHAHAHTHTHKHTPTVGRAGYVCIPG